MTIAAIEVSGAQQGSGARSYVYAFLARAFSFPSREFAADVSSGHWRAELDTVAQHLPFAFDPGQEASGALTVGFQELQQEYIRLFDVGLGRPFCPLYEGSHRHGRMKIMEELVRFYEHFGLRPEAGDQPDHLCAELEFMHFLAFKQAALLGRGQEVNDLALAQREFLHRHLSRWLPRLRARLEGAADALTLYPALARLAEAFCTADERYLKGRQGIPDQKIQPLPDRPPPDASSIK